LRDTIIVLYHIFVSAFIDANAPNRIIQFLSTIKFTEVIIFIVGVSIYALRARDLSVFLATVIAEPNRAFYALMDIRIRSVAKLAGIHTSFIILHIEETFFTARAQYLRVVNKTFITIPRAFLAYPLV